MMKLIPVLLISMFFLACTSDAGRHYIPKTNPDSAKAHSIRDTAIPADAPKWDYADSLSVQYINPGRTKAAELVDFAESLTGIPYLYASSDPRRGFDCSGFITYVFNHFGIAVPRSSEGFTSVEPEVSLRQARRGDLILFTGTDSTIRRVGHMGIITATDNRHEFIHATSGKAYGVTKTPLNKYYQGRFVKVIRVFNRQ